MSGLTRQRPHSAKPRRRTWGYGPSGSKSKSALTDANKKRFGKGVTAPTTPGGAGQRRRRPVSAIADRRRKGTGKGGDDALQPEFDDKHHQEKNQRAAAPMYTVKYLGISRGEIGILTRKVKLPTTTSRMPDKRSTASSNLGVHRERQYRLDPTLVTKNLKKFHERQYGPETEVDTGTVPVPDLYNSWKVSYAKQPRLLSARRTRFGVLPKGAILAAQPRHMDPGLAGRRSDLTRRPLTAVRARRREKDARTGGIKGRPSTAPMNRRRSGGGGAGGTPSRSGSSPDLLEELQQADPVAFNVAADTASSVPAKKPAAELAPSKTAAAHTAAALPIPNNDADAIAVSHDYILEEQLKQMEFEQMENQLKAGIAAERQRRDMANATEMPFCVHKRIRGWKLTSPARLWGPTKTRDWQRRSTKLMVVAPEVVATVAAESATLSTFGGAGHKMGPSGSRRNAGIPRPTEQKTEARKARVKADIDAFREAGIRQRKPAVVGHSWDRAVTPGLLSEAQCATNAEALGGGGGAGGGGDSTGGEVSLGWQNEEEQELAHRPEMEAYLQLLRSRK